jgi:hypothetical protein
MSRAWALYGAGALVALAWLGPLLGLLGGGEAPARPLREAKLGAAWVRDGAGDEPCRSVAQGFSCGPEGWHMVESREVQVSGRRERCIWAHPQQGRTLVLTVLTPPRPLRVGFALDDRAVGGGTPVEVVMSRGGEVARHTHADRVGWQGVVAPGPAGELLTLEISSARDGRRHFCFRFEGER